MPIDPTLEAMARQATATKDIARRVSALERQEHVNMVINAVAPVAPVPGMVWIQPSGIPGTPSTVWVRDATNAFWN